MFCREMDSDNSAPAFPSGFCMAFSPKTSGIPARVGLNDSHLRCITDANQEQHLIIANSIDETISCCRKRSTSNAFDDIFTSGVVLNNCDSLTSHGLESVSP